MDGWSLPAFAGFLPATLWLEIGPVSTVDSAALGAGTNPGTKKGESVMSQGSSGASNVARSASLYLFEQGKGLD